MINPSDVMHVFPVDDLVEHDTETSEPDCVCGPEVQPVVREDGSVEWLLVHQALDGRQ